MAPVRLGQFEFKYTTSGDAGPVVLLLHGFGGGPLDWRHLVPELSSEHRLVIPNLKPLFTAARPVPFSKQVELLAGLINHVNPAREEFVLVGTSFGATLSWGLRAHFQSLVSGHILINPMPLDPLPTLKSAQLRMLFGLNMVPGAMPLFLRTKMGRDLLIELGEIFGLGGHASEKKLALVSKAIQRFAWIAQHEDWSYWADQLRDHVIPALVITGNEDPLFSEKDFRSYQLRLPLSEHISLGKANHLLTRTHGPELANIIEGFIRSLNGDVRLNPVTLRYAI